MNLRFDHLGLLTDTREKNQDLADFFSGVLGLEVSGAASEGYAEVKAGAMPARRSRRVVQVRRLGLGLP
ncbi:hypothetical protein GCM10009804_08440 [Kribbella hippodromi]|uniref:VOC domain-containing protein n=1 Tax=Kribbella hippodromi TaxID=434347 RepID=A0ABP4N118_9ACTN